MKIEELEFEAKEGPIESGQRSDSRTGGSPGECYIPDGASSPWSHLNQWDLVPNVDGG